jgi:purine-binding chemotaxis protein CheW
LSGLATRARPVLIVTAGAVSCAIPLEHVVETMRPLPIEAVAGLPSFVLGVSVIRGVPTPVVDLAALLEGASGAPGRFVTLRLGDRSAALAVLGVAGVRSLDPGQLSSLPPLLRQDAGPLAGPPGETQEEAPAGPVSALGLRDARLLLVLRTALLVPEQVWKTLAQERS